MELSRGQYSEVDLPSRLSSHFGVLFRIVVIYLSSHFVMSSKSSYFVMSCCRNSILIVV